MASEAINLHRRCTSPGSGGGGSIGVRDIAPPFLGNLGAKFSETLFPHFKTCSTQIIIVISRQSFKTFDIFPIISLCLQCSLSKMGGP